MPTATEPPGARGPTVGLRIAVTVDPYIPVPPTTYGGIERVVAFLVRGLLERGHTVVLIAHPDSQLSDIKILGYGCPPHMTRRARAREIWQVWKRLETIREDIDVIHSFGRLAGLLPVLSRRRIAKLQSYQRDGVPWRSVRVAQAMAGQSLRFTGCSSSVYRGLDSNGPPHGTWTTVFNGVDTSLYRSAVTVSPDAPLVFLGRLEPIKGVHNAIAIAKRAGRRLVIAGNRVEEGGARGYFQDQIEPHLDQARIRWIGPVDDAAKGELLSAAAALLMPIEWEEPFGIVMVEAMACGTPVIAFRRGSVPEVVRERVNGFSCSSLDEAVQAVSRLESIDRAGVRADCELRFGASRIVEAYEALYRQLVDAAAGSDPRPSVT